MPEKYQFEQLDAETRGYLTLVRDKAGKGVPGVYASKPNYLPVIGLVGGIGLILVTLILTFPPTEDPTKEALLQTAGFLLGAWMVVAALRVWAAGKSGRYAGHFVYVDPETLYEASGSTVRVTDLGDLREAKAIQNFNEGNYQNTTITVKVGRGDRTTFEVKDEERGRRMTVYLNAVALMREGGEDGNERQWKALTPEQMGAMAGEVARTGEFPNPPPAGGSEVTRIPRPRKEGRASTGLLAIAFWAIVGVAIFFGFRTINAPFRDEVVFNRIKDLPPKDRTPALRVYLENKDFTTHRDEAQKLIDQAYDEGVRVNIKGGNAEVAEALRELILSLKTRQPVVSLITAEEKPPAANDQAGGMRETALRNSLADKLASTIGDELVAFAAPTKPDSTAVDTTLKGMIDIRWQFTTPNQVQYTIEFRKTPDDPPYLSQTFVVAAKADPTEFANVVGVNILNDTIGTVRPRPLNLNLDF